MRWRDYLMSGYRTSLLGTEICKKPCLSQKNYSKLTMNNSFACNETFI